MGFSGAGTDKDSNLIANMLKLFSDQEQELMRQRERTFRAQTETQKAQFQARLFHAVLGGQGVIQKAARSVAAEADAEVLRQRLAAQQNVVTTMGMRHKMQMTAEQVQHKKTIDDMGSRQVEQMAALHKASDTRAATARELGERAGALQARAAADQEAASRVAAAQNHAKKLNTALNTLRTQFLTAQREAHDATTTATKELQNAHHARVALLKQRISETETALSNANKEVLEAHEQRRKTVTDSRVQLAKLEDEKMDLLATLNTTERQAKAQRAQAVAEAEIKAQEQATRLQAEHEARLAKMRSERKAEEEQLLAQHHAAMAKLQQERKMEEQRLQKEHHQQLMNTTKTHQQREEELLEAKRREVEEVARAKEEETKRLQQLHVSALASADVQRQLALEKQQREHARAEAALKRQREEDLAARRAEYEAHLAKMEEERKAEEMAHKKAMEEAAVVAREKQNRMLKKSRRLITAKLKDVAQTSLSHAMSTVRVHKRGRNEMAGGDGEPSSRLRKQPRRSASASSRRRASVAQRALEAKTSAVTHALDKTQNAFKNHLQKELEDIETLTDHDWMVMFENIL